MDVKDTNHSHTWKRTTVEQRNRDKRRVRYDLGHKFIYDGHGDHGIYFRGDDPGPYDDAEFDHNNLYVQGIIGDGAAVVITTVITPVATPP